MAGKIKQLIDSIIMQRTNGNPALATSVKAKLIMKGINPDKFTAQSDDDPAVIDKLHKLAIDLGINL